MNRLESFKASLARESYHRPKPTGTENPIEPTPYLKLPFRKEDLLSIVIRCIQPQIRATTDYQISEGWIRSKRYLETITDKLHLPSAMALFHFPHGGIDFVLPYGFPIAAPCDGIAMSSYASFPVTSRHDQPKIKDGRLINKGVGYFVQIYNEQHDRTIQLAHLSNIHEDIPFSVPKLQGARWEARNHDLDRDTLICADNPSVVRVKQGQVVGFVGHSGMTYYPEYFEGYDRPFVIDPLKNGAIGIPHLHMEEFTRDLITGKKSWQRDPYNVYSRNLYYPTHSNNITMMHENLFIADEFGRPKYSDR